MTELRRLVPDPQAGEDDLHRLFALQRAASRREQAPSAGQRRERLARLRRLILANEATFAAAISDDFGTRASAETKLLEILPTLSAIRHASRNLARWMRPQRRRVDPAFLPGKAWLRHEPLGVVGIISPWNYPLQLAFSPLVDALAAGNRVMLKPSELTPNFSGLLQRLVAEAFDPLEVAVVTGGVEVGQAFAGLPFDHLLFTGSTAVGRKVYQAAAANLTPVTLELGGKSPAIICPDYPLAQAARSIAFGKWVNAGQTCIAPDYVLVPADRADALADGLIAQARISYPTVADNPDYSAMISDAHFARLSRALDEARAAGARVISHQDEGAAGRRKIGPTVVVGAPDDALFHTEEIFGPILPIIAYRDLDEAIASVAQRERPLALYCFARDSAQHERVLGRILSGGATLNGTLLHVAQESLPFGGVGHSGIGAYHGEEGFRRFSHPRAIFKVGPVNVMERLGPPWGKAAAFAADLLTRR